MKIFCEVEDCMYWNNGLCIQDDISIDMNRECANFEDYHDLQEWQAPFWKRMLDRDNNRICRVRYYGCEVEVNGRKFFVESRSKYAHLTDAITGMGAGQRRFIMDNFDKLVKCAMEVEIPLEYLPIAEYDEHSRTFSYKEKDGGSDA